MLFNTIALISATVLALASGASSAATNNKATVRTDERFCMMLPPDYGGGIAENEDRAISWCTAAVSTVPNGKILPDGFIVSQHFYTSSDGQYTQVTGTFDRSKMGYSKSDGGGQNDPQAPSGSSCVGYRYYVQLVEPDDQKYCLRCCNRRSDCPTGKSTAGCEAVIPGDYS
ncbi:hypothetical protein BGX31_010812 [Mortierella sp. GBA43]|nr:hypothetical protein BGX31_010812 [Mortierella sp. GBA43]